MAVRPTGPIALVAFVDEPVDDGRGGEGESRTHQNGRWDGQAEKRIGAEADHGRAERHLQRPEAEDIGDLFAYPGEREVEPDVEEEKDYAELGEHFDGVRVSEDGVARRAQREPDREIADDRAQSEVPRRHHGDDSQRQQQNDRIDRQKQLMSVRHRRSIFPSLDGGYTKRQFRRGCSRGPWRPRSIAGPRGGRTCCSRAPPARGAAWRRRAP
jgi:hypothetical protein